MTTVFEPRANVEAEEFVIGLSLFSRRAAEQAVSELEPSDFYRPVHAAAFAAIVDLHRQGMAIDALSVFDILSRRKDLEESLTIEMLRLMSYNVPPVTTTASSIAIIRREAAARLLDQAAVDTRNALAAREDPGEVADVLAERLRGLDRGGRLPDGYWSSWDDYSVAGHEGAGVPLIEGLCNQHTRTIVLASEKAGKSMLIRQVAFCAAAGVHPFTFKPIEPVRVLVIDAENDDDELMPSSELIRAVLNRNPGAQPSRPALLSRPFGMDLRSRRDRSEVEEVLETFRPQLIVGGPIYKIMPKREREDLDGHAAAMHQILDGFRKRWHCAIMLEHHAPTGKQGDSREIRSKGGQQWAAWPEVTVALHSRTHQNGSVSFDVRFPHPPRGRYNWPKRFDRATRPGEWPWIPVLRRAEEPPPLIEDLFDEEGF